MTFALQVCDTDNYKLRCNMFEISLTEKLSDHTSNVRITDTTKSYVAWYFVYAATPLKGNPSSRQNAYTFEFP